MILHQSYYLAQVNIAMLRAPPDHLFHLLHSLPSFILEDITQAMGGQESLLSVYLLAA
jgi:hypothetical protein